MRPRAGIWLWAAAIPFAAGSWAAGQGGEKSGGEDLAGQILPLLKGRCGTCHGASSPAGGLSVMTPEGLLRGGASGPAVVVGKAQDSPLVRRLKGLDGKPQMPMGFAPLSDEEIGRIERWIASGASFAGANRKHWAYVAPVRPALPQVRDANWVRNPVDAFVLARLEREGLPPSRQAAKETLLRRASLDLTGLPPTLEELDTFLKDTSPNAYERAVDRLLASPHYGERQARIWLDLARYADTNGFEADFSRTMWKWRDWVIRAYNANMPFDRFTIEQLAGDMLPNATLDQLIATGFHRNTMFNSEGGVDADEQYFEVVLDRVGTTGTVWLGQTLACARCHDHKYDPFTQEEFYKLYAVWNNSEYKQEGDFKVGQLKNIEPRMEAPSPEQAAEKARLQARVSAAEKALRGAEERAKATVGDWERAARALRWPAPLRLKISAESGASFRAEPDGSFVHLGPAPEDDEYRIEGTLPPGRWTGFRLEVLPDETFPKNGPGRASSGNFILSRVEALSGGRPVQLAGFEADFVQPGYALAGLVDEDGNTGWAVAPQVGKRHVLVGAFQRPLAGGQTVAWRLVMNSPSWKQHMIGRFRFGLTQAPDPLRFAFGEEVEQALVQGDRKPIEKWALQTHADVRSARNEVDSRKKDLADFAAKIPTALILREKPSNGVLKANLHIRGEWLQKGPMVEAGTPAVLPPLPRGARADRLGVARWLVSPENPLTSRVQVNRMWEQLFGRGLVETSDNFGTQGARPSHPELLDWLATEFVRLGWDTKKMLRLLVTSATYRQSSNASPALLMRDPKNELLARGPRFRMEAEMIRDNALAVSGLLSRKLGGPSVFPHQPEGIWNSPYNGERWSTSQGEDLYRRGLYTFWKRTAPYPSFLALDATSREQCTARRETTNTPLQALTLMNDPAFLEAARALAGRMLQEAGPEAKRRIEHGFRLCTGRTPSAEEVRALVRLKEKAAASFQRDPAKAKALAGDVPRAVWTMVANTLLNLDETITKG
jgi:mono/diheme cytochrome c family protein